MGKLRNGWAFTKALGVLIVIRLGLALRPFRQVSAWQQRLAGDATRCEPCDAAKVRRTVRGVERAARWVPGARCLAQAMAGQVLLARLGHATELRIGVARPAGSEGPDSAEEPADGVPSLTAHAWLEQGDRIVLGEAEPGRFTVLSKKAE